MSDIIQKCPRCKKEQWFTIAEYSPDHIEIVCDECKVRLYSDLEFHVCEWSEEP